MSKHTPIQSQLCRFDGKEHDALEHIVFYDDDGEPNGEITACSKCGKVTFERDLLAAK